MTDWPCWSIFAYLPPHARSTVISVTPIPAWRTRFSWFARLTTRSFSSWTSHGTPLTIIPRNSIASILTWTAFQPSLPLPSFISRDTCHSCNTWATDSAWPPIASIIALHARKTARTSAAFWSPKSPRSCSSARSYPTCSIILLVHLVSFGAIVGVMPLHVLVQDHGSVATSTQDVPPSL